MQVLLNTLKIPLDMAVIGVDLGGTKVAAAIFDRFGNMKDKEVALLGGLKATKWANW